MATEEEQDQTEETTSTAITNAPTFTNMAYEDTSSWSLPGNYIYPTRPFGGIARQELEQSSKPNIRFVPGKRNRRPPTRAGKGGRFYDGDMYESDPDSYNYDGPNLVGPSGMIEREPYSLDSSSIVGEIMSLGNVAQRRAILKSLYALGFYEGKTGPSMTGTQSRDISAFRQLLLAANAEGYTWDIVYSTIVNNPDYGRSAGGSYGGGGGGRLGGDNELAMVFASATHDMLGRAPTNKEINEYIRAYRSGGMSPTATAETLVSEQAGPEEDAYGYAQMAELMNRMLGGS